MMQSERFSAPSASGNSDQLCSYSWWKFPRHGLWLVWVLTPALTDRRHTNWLSEPIKLIFTAKSPTPGEIFCKPPDDFLINNASLWIKAAHKEKFNRVENEESYDFCRLYSDASSRYLNNVTQPGNSSDLVRCSSFEHRSIYISIINQYELFCYREALVALTQSFHLLGVLIGGIIAFYLLKMWVENYAKDLNL